MNILYSIIIPAYNEELLLPRLLDSIETARRQYSGSHEAIEIIVSDNTSTDRTAEIAQERGCRVITVEKRIIAAARNGGAAIAQGEVFCFCDADSQVHPETFNVIEEHMNSGNVMGGATGWKFERDSWGLKINFWVAAFLLWLARMNPGVIFCSAETFRDIGGYDENLDCAEDVRFFCAMRRQGRRQGLKTLRWTSAITTISTRKWDRHGEWHMFWAPFKGLFSRGSLKKNIRDYWYDDAR